MGSNKSIKLEYQIHLCDLTKNKMCTAHVAGAVVSLTTFSVRPAMSGVRCRCAIRVNVLLHKMLDKQTSTVLVFPKIFVTLCVCNTLT